MLKKVNAASRIIEIYQDGETIVEIWDCGKFFEAWITQKNYGVKTLMFGVPKEQQSYENFLAIVGAEYKQYADDFTEEYIN